MPSAGQSRRERLLETLGAYGIRPSRALGQNFLLDDNLIAAIVRDAAVGEGDVVLEVGPGSGLLTGALLDAGARVLAVELDRRLAAYLRDRFGGQDRLRLIEADILETKNRLNPLVVNAVHEETERKASRFLCVSNLPYSAAGPVLANLAGVALPVASGIFMIQREMADRLLACAGSGDYCALSVSAQVAASDISMLRHVPPDVFWPRPQVESALVRIDYFPEAERSAIPWTMLRRVTATIFSSRRKTLRNSLRALLGKGAGDAADGILASLDLDPEMRGESLPPARILQIAKLLSG